MQYHVLRSDRYHWSDLGEVDPAEQIVFDDVTGATHLVDGLARTIQSVVKDLPAGVPVDVICDAIGLSDPDDQSARRFVAELLAVMHRAELLEITEGSTLDAAGGPR